MVLMQSLQRQEKIVEKVLKTKAGEYVRAVFLVYEVNGNLEARLLSARPLSRSRFEIRDSTRPYRNGTFGQGFKKTVVCLPVTNQASTQSVANTKYFRTSSPYFNIFSFFNSQPTRAPSSSF